MNYEIIGTERARNQLYDIVRSIIENTRDVEEAVHYMQEITKAMEELQEYLHHGTALHYHIMRKYGFFVLEVAQCWIFYKLNEITKQVIIYAIVEGNHLL